MAAAAGINKLRVVEMDHVIMESSTGTKICKTVFIFFVGTNGKLSHG